MVRSRKKRKRLHLERFDNVMSERNPPRKLKNKASKKECNLFLTDLGIKNHQVWRCKKNWLPKIKKK
tara:strand:- start:3132 stop:3332 length:201 start_codon:yes stop_codon:yes gene_type:complete